MKDGIKIDLSGSLEQGVRGLRLRGEDLMVGKKRFYSTSPFGRRGFHSIDELDPKGSGEVLGGKARSNTEADTASISASGSPFGFYVFTGIALSKQSGETVVYGYQRKCMMTAMGRIVSIGAEERVVIGTTKDALEGSGVAAGSTGGFAYDENSRTIAPGAIAVGRQFIRVDGISDTTDGEYRIVINMAARTGTIEIGSGFATPTDTMTYAPLFTIVNGKVAEDYRGAVVAQAWE